MSGAGDQHASLCQISSKSVKRLQRYCHLTVLKMAAVRHLGFLKLNFFTIAVVKLRLNSGSGDGGGCSGIKIQQSGRIW